jgi:hypothetical protein
MNKSTESKHRRTKGRHASKQRSEVLDQLYQEWIERTAPADRITVTPNEERKNTNG